MRDEMVDFQKFGHNYGHKLHHVTEISQFLKVPGFMKQAAECEYTT